MYEYTNRAQPNRAQRFFFATGSGMGGSGGQAMLVTMLFTSALILSATTVAGFLMVHQIRQAVDAGSSVQATYAADAGIEAAFDCFFHRGLIQDDTCDVLAPGEDLSESAAFVTYDLSCQDSSGSAMCDSGNLTGFTVSARGTKGRTSRVLEVFYNFAPGA